MIINSIIGTALILLAVLVSWLPTVVTIPPIVGVDIDASLVAGIAVFNTITASFWPIADAFAAFLFLIAYYGIKNLLLRFFLGHRAP